MAHVWLIRALHAVLFAVAGATAFLLRFEFSVPADTKTALRYGIAIWVIGKLCAFRAVRLEHGIWRYFGGRDLVLLVAGNLAGSAVSAIVILMVCPPPFPRSVLVMDFLIALMLTAGVRGGSRILIESASRGGGQTRTFIYGAGGAGALLLAETRSNSAFHKHVYGFIDDNPEKRGMRINGVYVQGTGADLPQLATSRRIEEILIATPSATGAQMARIIEHCQNAGVKFRTMPSIAEIVQTRGIAAQIRDVAVEDVLGRSAVELDWDRIQNKLSGKVVLVTGAAGSIGSELCRQIARMRPAALVAFEIAESALFELENELRRAYPDLILHAEIGSVQNRQRLADVFSRYSPSIVYHAAAYKHVPLMEAHVFEAVENNVFGTYNVAAAAAEYCVEDFVMISSDKAVRPTNMMGATKCAAELVIRAMQNGGPRYVSVRFGNVLGSNGSVVPIFKRQIAAGGPVMVTHPDMRRYFMTIPEASQLVLQASSMGRGGEVFVLDMGEPVRIVDLARQLIVLSGLRPEHDIKIEFSGMRPGEKLYEELHGAEEPVMPTSHEKISVFAGASAPFHKMQRHLQVLRAACDRRDIRRLLFEMKDLVPGYNPSRELLERLIEPPVVRLARAVSSHQYTLPAQAELSEVAAD